MQTIDSTGKNSNLSEPSLARETQFACSTPNPFQQLLDMPRGRGSITGAVHCAPGSKGHVSRLLAAIQQAGRIKTADLSDATGLSSNLIWGLLKGPRARGAVEFAEGVWCVGPQSEAERKALMAAASLLRRHGWRVQPPSCQDDATDTDGDSDER